MNETSRRLTSSPHQHSMLSVLDLVILLGVWWCLVVSTCVFPVTHHAERLSICIVTVHVFSLLGYLSRSVAHFLKSIAFSYWVKKCFGCNSFVWYVFCRCFLPVRGLYIFTFLILFFIEQKFLILMKSSLSIISFMTLLFMLYLNNHCKTKVIQLFSYVLRVSLFCVLH